MKTLVIGTQALLVFAWFGLAPPPGAVALEPLPSQQQAAPVSKQAAPAPKQAQMSSARIESPALAMTSPPSLMISGAFALVSIALTGNRPRLRG